MCRVEPMHTYRCVDIQPAVVYIRALRVYIQHFVLVKVKKEKCTRVNTSFLFILSTITVFLNPYTLARGDIQPAVVYIRALRVYIQHFVLVKVKNRSVHRLHFFPFYSLYHNHTNGVYSSSRRAFSLLYLSDRMIVDGATP